jgi:beta-glucosidase
VVIVVAALTHDDEGEAWNNGGDRDTLEVSADQVALINQVAAMHDRVIVLLEGGGPITGTWMNNVEAVVMAWYPGEKGGLAIADLLLGNANFGGHVPMTWPVAWADEPVFGNHQATTQMDYYHGYRYFDKNAITPLFPFGWGLSYTTFQYANLTVPCADVTHGGVMDVSFDVTNTGTMAGDTVAFLFVSFENTTVRRSVKELKGFKRIALQPNETQHVTIPLKIADLAYWDMTTGGWAIENMTYTVRVGQHSADLPLSATFTVR